MITCIVSPVSDNLARLAKALQSSKSVRCILFWPLYPLYGHPAAHAVACWPRAMLPSSATHYKASRCRLHCHRRHVTKKSPAASLAQFHGTCRSPFCHHLTPLLASTAIDGHLLLVSHCTHPGNVGARHIRFPDDHHIR